MKGLFNWNMQRNHSCKTCININICKFSHIYAHVCAPCCWGGVRPPCRASSASPPERTRRPSAWSSSSEPCGRPRHEPGCAFSVLWPKYKFRVKRWKNYSPRPFFYWSVFSQTAPFFFLRGTFRTSFLVLFLFIPFPPTTRWIREAGSTVNWWENSLLYNKKKIYI